MKPVLLKKSQPVIIKADSKYERGLRVNLVGEGGYDIQYWYGKPNKVYPAEVKVDGRTVSKNGTTVHIGYHPELKEGAYGNPASNGSMDLSKPLAAFDATLAGLLAYGGYQSKGLQRYTQYLAAAYLALGAYYHSTGRIEIKKK